MSREIKFRAWAKKRKGYRELDQLVFYNQRLEEVWAFPKDDETQQVYHPSEVIIEQYTGLTDKNGKEIYEGDIVKLYDNNYIVIWSETNFAFIFSSERQYYWLSPSKKEDCQVIGNIHENPELLEENK